MMEFSYGSWSVLPSKPMTFSPLLLALVSQSRSSILPSTAEPLVPWSSEWWADNGAGENSHWALVMMLSEIQNVSRFDQNNSKQGIILNIVFLYTLEVCSQNSPYFWPGSITTMKAIMTQNVKELICIRIWIHL